VAQQMAFSVTGAPISKLGLILATQAEMCWPDMTKNRKLIFCIKQTFFGYPSWPPFELITKEKTDSNLHQQ
jgi:hypothetical protein